MKVVAGERKGRLTGLVNVGTNPVGELMAPGETFVDPFPEKTIGRGEVAGLLVVPPTVDRGALTAGTIGTLTVVVAKLEPAVEAAAAALALLDVAPGVKVLWLLLKVPAGEMLVALLLPPAPVLFTKELLLLLLKV
jgi:hypothetical protein